MFCGKCGANLPEDAKFCSSCGNAIESVSADTTLPITEEPVVMQESVTAVACLHSGTID